jgi:hypothetical protein
VAELHVIADRTYRETVPTLRALADAIEAGQYGDVSAVGVVLLADEMRVFGMGPGSDSTAVALLLHAGFLKISAAVAGIGGKR